MNGWRIIIMKIACTCAKCHTIFVGSETDTFMEFDFEAQQIRFYCRNVQCKHVNMMDFSDWQEKQKHSPLPPTRIM